MERQGTGIDLRSEREGENSLRQQVIFLVAVEQDGVPELRERCMRKRVAGGDALDRLASVIESIAGRREQRPFPTSPERLLITKLQLLTTVRGTL